MTLLPSLSSIHFVTDLVQDPLKYAKNQGYYPDFFEKVTQRLALFNILAVIDALSSTKKYVEILTEDTHYSDYRSIASSSLHVVSSTFDSIRYTEMFEKAVGNYLKSSSSIIPTIDCIGKYILIGKISMGAREIYESYLFLNELQDPEKVIKNNLKDHAEIQAYTRNTSEHVVKQIQSSTIKKDKLCSVAKLALRKKVAQLAVNVIRLVALFFLSNAVVIHTLLFACKLSKPMIETYFIKPLAKYPVV